MPASWRYINLLINFSICFTGYARKFGNVLDRKFYLRLKQFRLIVIINFLIFIVLNILNTILIFIIDQNSFFKIQLNLPGTGSAGSDPLIISLLLYIILIVSPLFAAASLFLSYREVNSFSKKELDRAEKRKSGFIGYCEFYPGVKCYLWKYLK